MMVASMVSVPLCLILLGQSLMALTSPVSSERVERAYSAQALAGLIGNLTDRLKSLEAHITEQEKAYGVKALAGLIDSLASRLTRLEASVPDGIAILEDAIEKDNMHIVMCGDQNPRTGNEQPVTDHSADYITGYFEDDGPSEPPPVRQPKDYVANKFGRQNEVNQKRCETGVVHFAPHDRPGVLAPDGRVKKTHSVHVIFRSPFATKPWVSVAITYLDVYNYANVRVDVGADAVSTSGFDAFAYEWGDTHVVLVKVSWVACNI